MANQDPVKAMEALQRQSQERYQQLQTRYREDLSRLEEEQRRQMAQSRSRMLEMIREQQTEQVQQIRSEMEALRRETRERIAALERERDRKLEELQDYYQRELDRLMERFLKNEEAEKNYAEIQHRAAQTAVRALEEDPTVKLFLPGAAAAAKERLESAEPLFEQRLYVVAAARWFTVAVTAASRSQEAREIRERWERRKKAAGERMLEIRTRMRETLEDERIFRHVLADSTEIPFKWVESLPRAVRLSGTMEKAQEILDTAPPGETEPFDRAELTTFGMEEEIDGLSLEAGRRILAFLCCVEMMQLFYDAAGEEWEVYDGGSVERFSCQGRMVLSNGLDDRIRVQVFPKKDDRNMFVLIALYTGHRANPVLFRRLMAIVRDFDRSVRDPGMCGMLIAASGDFIEEGCPGIRLELRLMSAGMGQQEGEGV